MSSATDRVLLGELQYHTEEADCLDFLPRLPAGGVDLVLGSPPYEGARLYLENGQDLGIARTTEAWVAWMVQVVQASLRASVGLVAFVVEGQTKKFRWSAGPALLMADLVRAGVCLRKPPVYHRVGIPGSGGPDWLRNDYEFIVCATHGGKLPWSDNTACGHPPKWAPGGAMSHRVADGARVNQWGMNGLVDGKSGHKSEKHVGEFRPSHKLRRVTSGHANGDTPSADSYAPPALANPGNVLKCLVGGGLIGDALAHENEAPFPEKLAEFFVLSFCRPGGVVCDPFAGSGTTAKVALTNNRRFVGCDLRPSQVELSRRRCELITPKALYDTEV